ncbi:MAG: 2-amino-4-hydroxy-6-hydroxymethyldihydropteridine diphosphokinase [Gammaproteobacteria bacterium]
MSEPVAVFETVYIGLGSNLEQPKQNIARALAELKQLADTRYIADSGLFRSKPMGPQDQPDYLNAVVQLETRLDAPQLLSCMQQIENSMGRTRSQHWGPRIIDLDILLFGEHRVDEPDLHVPHPGIELREFVLYPLQRLNPALLIPGRGKLSTLIEQCPQNGLHYVGEIA